jgi:ubiquinone biosynthesis protein UbiJ
MPPFRPPVTLAEACNDIEELQHQVEDLQYRLRELEEHLEPKQKEADNG